ncbi:uncharacterized protein VTP21DRAFT_10437 [Calcarisporiella thermophila]|uniref:uncharacterized protein n=1 Tax=Calcarisporiella thermophila TaxID=911321 RepID=UPI0037434CD7
MIAFPYFCPANESASYYSGFITISGQEYFLEIEIPSNQKDLSGAILYGCPALRNLLAPHKTAIQQRLDQCSDITSFLLDLREFLERNVNYDKPLWKPAATFYMTLLAELEEIGWEKLQYIEPSLMKMQFLIRGVSGREHHIHISLPPNYPDSSPQVRVDIPVPLKIDFKNPGIPQINHILNACREVIQTYEPLWDVLDDLDENAWILEPDKPSRSDLMRRLSLGNHCSLQIELDPEMPRALCKCRLFGPEHAISSLRENMNRNRQLWNPAHSVRKNLEILLECSLPSRRKSNEDEEYSVSCGICYAYQINGRIPDQMCNNTLCGQPFHQTCLYEWLRSIPSTRQSFNCLFGACPYCKDSIMTTSFETIK